MNYPTKANTYNGWSNYETWNISLYIINEYKLYVLACAWVTDRKQQGQDVSYNAFIPVLEAISESTPDDVSWRNQWVNTDELDEMLSDLTTD